MYLQEDKLYKYWKERIKEIRDEGASDEDLLKAACEYVLLYFNETCNQRERAHKHLIALFDELED